MMRYWITLDSISKRIVRVSAELSVAMRLFCYAFVLGLILKPNFPLELGFFTIEKNFASSLTGPVFLFIFLDLAHPFLYLLALHIDFLFRWKSYKKYDGNENEEYNESLDRSELIFELNPLERFGLSILPNLMLFCKTCVVGFIILKILINIIL